MPSYQCQSRGHMKPLSRPAQACLLQTPQRLQLTGLVHAQKEGALEEVAVARVMYEVLKVVATCHSHSLVHGDIKPANFVMKMHHASAHTALHTGRGLSGAWLKAVDFGESPVWSCAACALHHVAAFWACAFAEHMCLHLVVPPAMLWLCACVLSCKLALQAAARQC